MNSKPYSFLVLRHAGRFRSTPDGLVHFLLFLFSNSTSDALVFFLVLAISLVHSWVAPVARLSQARGCIAENLEEDGSLVIEVDIRIAADSKLAWYPKKLHQQEILVELYHDAAETSDIIFNVEGKKYHAH